jgi:hypothetical protein
MSRRELEDRRAPAPARTLEKLGLTAVADLAGGLLLLILSVLGGRIPVVGIILGVLTGVFGLAALLSKDRADRKAGAVLAAGGILTVLSRVGAAFFRPVAGTLLSIGAFGLLAMGLWNGVKFIRGLKSRG